MTYHLTMSKVTLLLLLIAVLSLLPPGGYASHEKTLLIIFVEGIPDNFKVKIYINGRYVGDASSSSPLILQVEKGISLNITSTAFIEAGFGGSYSLSQIISSNSRGEKVLTIMTSEVNWVVCKYTYSNILLSPLMLPVYILIVLLYLLWILKKRVKAVQSKRD